MEDNKDIIMNKWQAQLDAGFPQGAWCYWVESHDIHYGVPWIEVTGTVGLDAVVKLRSVTSDRVLDNLHITSYTESPKDGPGFVRVTFDNEPQTMVWSPQVPAGLVKEFAPLRKQLIAQAGAGG